MPTRLDKANNWIQAEFKVDTKHHEDAADYLVKLMNSFAPRTLIKEGRTVRLLHIEMSAAMFEQFCMLHRSFPAFRITKFRVMTSRNAIGILCGHTIILNNDIPNEVRFQYKEVVSQECEYLPDPFFISSPKVNLLASASGS